MMTGIGRLRTTLTATRCLAKNLGSADTTQRAVRGVLTVPRLAIFERPQTRESTTMTDQKQATHPVSHSTRMYKVSPTELVVKQRLNRPVSPHLGVYSWKIMICGALHRNTAILLSGTMYLFGFSYLALPLIGIPFGSTELVAWFGNLSVAVKVAIKWLYGFAFSFHCAHGLRHLIWDTGVMFGNAQVLRTGMAALAVGALAATGLCFV